MEATSGFSHGKAGSGVKVGHPFGEATAAIRMLTRRLGPLPEAQVAHIRGLALPQLEELLDVVLDVADGAELSAWLAAHPPINPPSP